MARSNDPAKYNRYVYCQDNPINRVDPDGHVAFLLALTPEMIQATIMGIGAVVATYENIKGMIEHARHYAKSDIRKQASTGKEKAKTRQPTSPNRLQQQVEKGKAPRTVDRVDRGKIYGEKDHIHFKDGSALNKDGTWKHGEKELTKAEKEWIEDNGWETPSEDSSDSESESDDKN
jgi:hypothetical protein